MKTAEELKTASFTGEVSDDNNPLFAFSTMTNELLTAFAKGKYDIDFFLRNELASRGLNINGQWIGFKAAKAEFKL